MNPYRQAITDAMTEAAQNPQARFVGYGILHGRAMGTMQAAQPGQIVETPVAENLMAGIATGLALSGHAPVLFFERFDFVLNAADAIVNHLDKAAVLSRSRFAPCVIIRVVVGNTAKPLYTGATHVQDFTRAFRAMLRMPVHALRTAEDATEHYARALLHQETGICSTMLVEYKDLL